MALWGVPDLVGDVRVSFAAGAEVAAVLVRSSLGDAVAVVGGVDHALVAGEAELVERRLGEFELESLGGVPVGVGGERRDAGPADLVEGRGRVGGADLEGALGGCHAISSRFRAEVDEHHAVPLEDRGERDAGGLGGFRREKGVEALEAAAPAFESRLLGRLGREEGGCSRLGGLEPDLDDVDALYRGGAAFAVVERLDIERVGEVVERVEKGQVGRGHRDQSRGRVVSGGGVLQRGVVHVFHQVLVALGDTRDEGLEDDLFAFVAGGLNGDRARGGDLLALDGDVVGHGRLRSLPRRVVG